MPCALYNHSHPTYIENQDIYFRIIIYKLSTAKFPARSAKDGRLKLAAAAIPRSKMH